MRLVARYDSIGYRVPGGETLWVELDGRTVGVHDRPAYQHADGTLEPGLLRSPIATDVRVTHYPDEGVRVRPLVCGSCGDSGVSPDFNTEGGDICRSCMGLGDEKNLRTCAYCGEIQYHPAPVLPIAPREVLNHELLLERMHPACAVESQVTHVGAVMVGRA